jgi:hypothetical protein
MLLRSGQYGIVVVCAAIAGGCVYLHSKTIDNVLATGWDDSGVPVSLVQEVSLRWGMVVKVPDTQDPKYDLGPLVMLRTGNVRTPAVPEFAEWWHIEWIAARAHGKGFVVNGSKGDPLRNVCLLIQLSGSITPCTFDVRANVAHRTVWLDSEGDKVIVWNDEDHSGQEIDITTGKASATAASVPEGLLNGPCRDRSFSAISPRADKWAVACDGGIWITDGESSQLIHKESWSAMDPVAPDEVSAEANMIRPWLEMYGLAWSPDEHFVYWCSPRRQRGVVVAVEGSAARPTTRCLTGATWSPDGQRIAGNEEGEMQVLRRGLDW